MNKFSAPENAPEPDDADAAEAREDSDAIPQTGSKTQPQRGATIEPQTGSKTSG